VGYNFWEYRPAEQLICLRILAAISATFETSDPPLPTWHCEFCFSYLLVDIGEVAWLFTRNWLIKIPSSFYMNNPIIKSCTWMATHKAPLCLSLGSLLRFSHLLLVEHFESLHYPLSSQSLSHQHYWQPRPRIHLVRRSLPSRWRGQTVRLEWLLARVRARMADGIRRRPIDFLLSFQL
jgi:hypothetical protein